VEKVEKNVWMGRLIRLYWELGEAIRRRSRWGQRVGAVALPKFGGKYF